MYDVIIIGAGPAGMTAGLYAVRSGLSTVILESEVYGGQVVNTAEIENYPCVKSIAGWEMAQQMYDQITDAGVSVVFDKVISLKKNGDFFTVEANDNSYECKSVIIANGAKRRKLGCEGEEEFSGKGVSYCATCDGSFFKDKKVAVVGGGNTALEDALYLSNICNKVFLVHRREEFRGEKQLSDALPQRKNIELMLGFVPEKISGSERVEEILLKRVNSTETEILKVDAVFVAIGMEPDNKAFAEVVQINEGGYIVANESCETSCPGVYVAGDTRTKVLRQIVTAVSDGAIAAAQALGYIRHCK